MTKFKRDIRVRVKDAVCIGRIQWVYDEDQTAMVRWEGTSVEDFIPLNELEEVILDPI